MNRTFPAATIPDEVERALIDQIARTPPGEAPAPTVSAAGCLGAVAVGVVVLAAVHTGLTALSLGTLWRLPVELGATLLAGYLVTRLWTRSHRSWGALTDSGRPPSRDELY